MSDARDHHERLARAFDAVRGLPEDQRAAALDAECGGDPEFRSQIERLIADSTRDDAFADDAVDEGDRLAALGAGVPPQRGGVPEQIGEYSIVGVLGTGGMGTVYEAVQEHPKRRVALKTIRPGLMTAAMLRRFRREADVLGRLTHPGIAQVYEVDTSERNGAGTPYIAMELVDGRPLTGYAEDAALGTRQRLELACAVCDAVEYAHQRGVIHRDLKPANILVDERGQPKILDFGVARITESDIELTTMQTTAGQIIGTASYMSPEQATGDIDGVDTRSDIYSLGVVIFELLTARLPITVEKLPLPDAIRAIREAEPTRIGSLDTSLRGDIDTILAKALDRDLSKRYQTASEFGADIRRHLDDQPIVARPPSAMYQLKKFARRNRAVVGSATAIALALIVGLAGTSLALKRETEARNNAELSLERAIAASEFLEQILLGLSHKETAHRDTELLEAMLEKAEAALEDNEIHPAVRAEMLSILGRTHQKFSSYQRAAELLDESDRIYQTIGEAGRSYSKDASLVRADAHKQIGNRAVSREILGNAIEKYAEAGDTVLLSQARVLLAEILMDAGDWDAALAEIERALEHADDIDDIALGRAKMLHGAILRRLQRYNEARDAYDRSLALFRDAGADLETVITLSSLGVLSMNLDRFDDAERYYTEALEIRLGIDSRPNAQTANIYSNLGKVLFLIDRPEEARSRLVDSIQMHIDVFGSEHFTVAYPTATLARLESKQGRHGDAISLASRAVELMELQFGPQHPVSLTMRAQLGMSQVRGDQPAEAEATFRHCVGVIEAGEFQPATHEFPVYAGLGKALDALGRTGEARAAFEKALSKVPHTDARTAEIREHLARLDRD